MRVIGGHDDQRFVQVHLVERGGDGLVQVVGLADLAASVGVVVLLVDRGALDLQEEAVALAVRVGLEQVDGLARHVGQGGGVAVGVLVAEPVGVGGALDRVLVLGRVLLGGHARRELGLQVAVRHQGEDRLAGVLQRVERVDVLLDGLVAHGLRLIPNGHALVLAALHGLVQILGAAADRHVGAGVEHLLGDRADAAVLLELGDLALVGGVVAGAVGLALRSIAGAQRGMRHLGCRGGVLDFGGGHVAGGLAGGLGQLGQVHLRGAVDIHVQRVVVGLGTGGPCGTGGRGVGDRGHRRIVLILNARAERERGVLAGANGGVAVSGRLSDTVEAIERAVRAMQVVAGDGDFGIAHAIADEQDDVLGLGVADGDVLDALRAAVHGQVGGLLAVGRVGHAAGAGERGGGDERRHGSLQHVMLVHFCLFSLASQRGRPRSPWVTATLGIPVMPVFPALRFPTTHARPPNRRPADGIATQW